MPHFFLIFFAFCTVRRVSDGYKIHRFAVYALMAIQLVAANVFVVGLLNYFNAIDVQPPSLSSTTAVVHLLGSLALNLIVSEIAFTAGHAWLHSTTVGKRIHRLHHLIKNPSWSTNLLIHPLDLAIEFGLPFLAIALMHVYVVGDPFVFRVAITLIYVWYAADHSENLGLSHTVHHTSMESPILTIYGRYEWFERLMGGRSKSKIS